MPQEYRLILKNVDQPGYTPDLACYLRHSGYEALKKALALPILTKIDDTVFSDGPSVFGRTSRAQVLNPASRVRAIVGYVPPAVRKGAISLHRSPGTVLRLTRGLYAHWNHG